MVTLDESQLELVRERLAHLTRPLTLTLRPGPDPEDPFAISLVHVIELIAAQAPDLVRLEEAEEPVREERKSYPALTVENVTYLAVPLERELEPFLDLLVTLSSATPDGKSRAAADEAIIEVLVAPTCPNCPLVVRACAEVAATAPNIRLRIIDVQYFSELARSSRSVPTVIIDGERTVVGPVTADEIHDLLQDRHRPGYQVRTLASMIESGRAREASRLIVTDEGYAALAELLGEASMQQRMGLMLAVQAALERNPHALDGALPHLLPLLESEDPTLRGDTADMIGQIGAPGARAALTRLLGDENPDVREVAEDALSMLRAPS
jgi:alkyl hydroperoxide reductase subunit AhpF